MTLKDNPHEGRRCRECDVVLNRANAHCDNGQCPWCDRCLKLRRAQGEARKNG